MVYLTLLLTCLLLTGMQVGERKAEQAKQGGPEEAWGKGVYFIGKALWAKGYTELIQRMDEHQQRTGEHVHVDVYGCGPDRKVRDTVWHRELVSLLIGG